MSGQGEELQARNDVGQRGLWLQSRDVISAVIELVVAALIVVSYISVPRSAQWLLVYAAVMYAIAIVTALVARGVARPRTGLRRSIIGAVLWTFLLIPAEFGSVVIVQALSQLVGVHRVDWNVIKLLGMILYFLLYLPLLLLARGTTTRS